MLLEEKDRGLFKQWLLPKLETISDAEAGVLADYVIALITAEGPAAAVKQDCVEALSDFLQDQARPFVDEITSAIEQKSWLSDQGAKAKTEAAKAAAAPKQPTLAPTAPIPSIVGSASEPYLPSPALSAAAASFVPRGPKADLRKAPPEAPRHPKGSASRINDLSAEQPPLSTRQITNQNGIASQSRKRKLAERATSQPPDTQGGYDNRNINGERPSKARRGGRSNTRGGFGTSERGFVPAPAPGSRVVSNTVPSFSGLPQIPNMPAGFPPIDYSNPMAFMATLVAFFGMPFPGQSLPPARARCKDYDTKGFCTRGSMCAYEHGEVPEYDPNHASLGVPRTKATNGRRKTRPAKGHQNGVQSNGSSNSHRIQLSSWNDATYEPTKPAIAVTQIPDDHLNEEHVKEFFSRFGTIINVHIEPHKHLAVVQFKDNAAAERAHDSPKVIFDNRFVKVSWYKPDWNRTTRIRAFPVDENIPEIYEDEDAIDFEEFKKQQEEAQKAFEERREKIADAEKRNQNIIKQIVSKEGEMRDLKLKLHEMARAKGIELSTMGEEDRDSLMADLLDLETDTDGFFAQFESDTSSIGHRGGFRGRGRGYSARGQGLISRGSYRGRGYGHRHSGVKRLDNRPKRLAIAEVEAGSQKDEALRQFLLNAQGVKGIYPHTDRPNTLIVSFAERYQAEIFVDEAASIPNVGDLDLSWVPNNVSVVAESGEGAPFALHVDSNDESSTAGEEGEIEIKEEGEIEIKKEEEQVNGVEADLDVADDADQWL